MIWGAIIGLILYVIFRKGPFVISWALMGVGLGACVAILVLCLISVRTALSSDTPNRLIGVAGKRGEVIRDALAARVDQPDGCGDVMCRYAKPGDAGDDDIFVRFFLPADKVEKIVTTDTDPYYDGLAVEIGYETRVSYLTSFLLVGYPSDWLAHNVGDRPVSFKIIRPVTE